MAGLMRLLCSSGRECFGRSVASLVRGCRPVMLCHSPGGVGRAIGLVAEVPPEKFPEMRVFVGHCYS